MFQPLNCSLALQLLPNFGAASYWSLVENFGSLSAVYKANNQQLGICLDSIQLRLFDSWREQRGALFDAVEKELELAESHAIQLIHSEHHNYPKLLKEIKRAPPLLYIKGNADALDLPQVAIVGARKASITGRELAAEFACGLAQSGFVITSGLALGIDACAHQGALAAARQSQLAQQAPTIAVLGSGLLRIYPLRNRQLAEEIIDQGGALVSEFALTQQAMSHHFPQRNRIIVGLSVATLVVEAEIKSGSLISARFALEQNRDLFAIPGSVRNPLSAGCHRLIKDGAALVEKPQELIEALRHWSTYYQAELFSSAQPTSTVLASELQPVFDVIGWESTCIDQIVARCSLPITEINSCLLQLELQGVIQNTGLGYVRC